MFIIGIVFAVAGFMLGFGDNGRGTNSTTISTAAGLLWLGGVIAAFWTEGVQFGFISILVSFVIAGITSRLGKYVILRIRG